MNRKEHVGEPQSTLKGTPVTTPGVVERVDVSRRKTEKVRKASPGCQWRSNTKVQAEREL
jgi:hypothetical protein